MIIPLQERLDRLTRWFNRQNERPLLGFHHGSQYPLHRHPGSMKRIPDGIVHPEDIVIEDYMEDTERLYQTYEAGGGDLVWAASPFWGVPWVEAALGCTIIADHKSGSSRSVPPVGFADNPVVSEFSPDNPWFRKLVEFYPALQKQACGRYPIAGTHMRGISDLLAALYGGEAFLMRMYEAPDEVEMVAKRLADFWLAFGKSLMERVPSFQGGTGAFFYAVWCPGRTIWMQDDATALMSPELYERFIYPHNVRIISEFEHTVMHLHPGRFIPIDHLLKSDLDVFELHIDKGGPTAEQLYETHMKVLAAKPLIVWGDLTQDDFDFILGHLPSQGLAINTVVESKQQAEAYWHKLEKRYSREN